MRGCRPLTKREALKVKSIFKGRNALRNRTLFLLGVNTGFRISELLSLRIHSVMDSAGRVEDRITVARKNMKGQHSGRTVLLNSHAKEALREYLAELGKNKKYLFLGDDTRNGQIEYLNMDMCLFGSERDPQKPIDRIQAWKVLNRAFNDAKLHGKLGTHALRKTFANNVYKNLMRRSCEGESIDPFRATSKALGHKDINSTDKYLSFREDEIDKTIEDVGV